MTEETLFVLVDGELAAAGVTSGATLDEAREAMRRLETAGLSRPVAGSTIVRQPPEPELQAISNPASLPAPASTAALE